MRWRVPMVLLALVGLCWHALLTQAHGPAIATVFGRVFEDTNGNGKWEAGEPCVSSVVTLRPVSAGEARTIALTCGQASFYQFSEVPHGDYFLSAAPGTSGDFALTPLTFTVPDGATEVRQDLPLQRRRSGIGGRAVTDANADGQVSESDTPLANLTVRLLDAIGDPVATQQTGADGTYFFANPTPDRSYLIEIPEQAGVQLRRAFAGEGAEVVGGTVIRIRALQSNRLYAGNNFLFAGTSTPPIPGGGPQIQQLLSVGATMPAPGRLGMFGIDPRGLDRDISVIRRVTADGSVYVLDYAGSALLRLHADRREVVLDTTSLDPVDGVGIVRLLRVETSLNRISGVLALRADGTRGIYQFEDLRRPDDPHRLRRLALLPDDRDQPVALRVPEELAISDEGDVVYVAPVEATPTSPLGVFRSTKDHVTELLFRVQGSERFSNLTSNGAGDVAFLENRFQPNGSLSGQRLLRFSRISGLQTVAQVGSLVEQARSAGVRGGLTALRRPRIGPEGSVVFQGSGEGFSNFFVQGPNRPLQPIMPRTEWNNTAATYDYEIASNGSIALRAAEGRSTDSALYLALPTGGVLTVDPPGDIIQPAGQPAFVPGGNESLFFFVAKAFNRALPPDRTGNPPVVLCRSRMVSGRPRVDAAAAPGETVPERVETKLLTMVQAPIVARDRVTIGALFTRPNSSRVPIAGLFQIPLDGVTKDARLLAEEGAELQDANRIAILRDLSFAADGSLVFAGLLAGAGPVIGTLPSSAATAGRFRTQAVTPNPIVAIGDDLGSGRRLLAGPVRLMSLDRDRHLLAARYGLETGGAGEGLFSIGTDRRPVALAVTDDVAVKVDPASDLNAWRFAGFGQAEAEGEGSAYRLFAPAVSPDGGVSFKARLGREGGENFGLFQWAGPGALTPVSLASEALVATDPTPYTLERWAIANPRLLYFQARAHRSRARLFRWATAAQLTTAAPTPLPGATSLADVFDFALAGEGAVFAYGQDAVGRGLFRVDQATPTLLVREGAALPPLSVGGTQPPGVFDLSSGNVELLAASAQGPLLFTAGVRQRPGAASARGLFAFDPRLPQPRVETRFVEELAVQGARDIGYGHLPTWNTQQSRNGITVSAVRGAAGRWTILHMSPVRDAQGRQVLAGGIPQFRSTVIAQEGQALPDRTPIQSLDPSRDLQLQTSSGPVFALSEAGDVAFLASNGKRWSIYQYSTK